MTSRKKFIMQGLNKRVFGFFGIKLKLMIIMHASIAIFCCKRISPPIPG